MGKQIDYNPFKAPEDDKLMHFLVGYIICDLSYLFTGSEVLSIVAVTSAAILKEAYDYFDENHSCEVADALYTILGGTAAWLTVY